MFKESGKKQPKIPASYEFLPAMTHTPVAVVSLCSLVDGCKRKNADQNNSEYGHFLRSVRLENITESHRKTTEPSSIFDKVAGEQSKSLLNLHIEIPYICLSLVLIGVHF